MAALSFRVSHYYRYHKAGIGRPFRPHGLSSSPIGSERGHMTARD